MSSSPDTPARVIALVVVHHVPFPEEAQATAVAVALAESGGKMVTVPDNPKGRTGCTSSGWFQINFCPGRDDGNPNRDPKVSPVDKDPVANARAALAISSGGTNWRPWTTYTSGKHRKYLQEAHAAVTWAKSSDGRFWAQTAKPGTGTGKASAGGIIGDAISDPAGIPGAVAGFLDAMNPMDELAALLGMLTSWETWRRVLFVVLGLGLLAGGTALLISDQV